ALATPPYANAATRTDVPCAVSQTDCLVWHASFCSEGRRLIRTLLDRLHKTRTFVQSLRRFSVWFKRRFSVPACGLTPRRAQRRSRLAGGPRPWGGVVLTATSTARGFDQVGRCHVAAADGSML